MRRTLVVAMVLASTLAVSRPTLGCSVTSPGPTEEQLFAAADVVFEGVAGGHRDPAAGASVQSSGDPIFWTFAVDREIKGHVGPSVEVASARSSATCGITFQPGVRYRVFARYQNGTLQTGLGSGTRTAQVTTSTTPTTAPATPTTTAPRPATPSAPRQIALTG